MLRTLTLVLSLAFSSLALAASGKAHIAPFENYFFDNNDFKRAWINVSNITDEPVTVNFTLYDHAGNIVTDGNGTGASGPLRAQYNYTNYNDNFTDKSATFVLPAHASARLHVQGTSSGKIMYGNIEWQQNSKASVALISSVEINRFISETSRQSAQTQTLTVNNSLPF